MVKEVQGVYNNIDEAVAKVESLNERGYEEKDITILANREVEKDLPWNVDAEVSTTDDDDKGLWDSIKSAFVVEDVDEEPASDEFSSIRNTHRADLDAGKILVLIDDDAVVHHGDYNNNEINSHVAAGATTDNYPEAEPSEVDRTTGEVSATEAVHPTETHVQAETENIQLKEERVNIDKEERQTGEVEVDKRVVEETETVDVPVKREEVVIKRKPAHGKTTNEEISDVDDDEIVIPTKEEHVNVSKDTEVVEEVEVSKEVHEDTETVEETVRHEELEVDGDYTDR